MENDYSKLWEDCLAMIREKYGDKFRHWYDVWFGDVRFESYDPDTHVLLVQVPSKYVYEFQEMNGAKDIRWATKEVFKTDIILKYRILEPRREPDFAQVADYLRQQGCTVGTERPHFRIADAEKRMRDGLRYFLGHDGQWLPAYDKVATWLSDNKGRGLVCIGYSGTGKTLLCTKVLPVILGYKSIVQCTAKEMTLRNGNVERIDELLKAKCIIIDGLGTESVDTNYYGRRRRPFEELCDAAESDGKLLIITTNCLSTKPMPDTWAGKSQFPTSFEEYYGQNVINRLKSITTTVLFSGPNLW